MASDHFHDRLPRFAYFISYCIAKGFDTSYMTPGYSVMYSHQAWRAMLPLSPRLRTWFQRRIEPWFEVRASRGAVDRASDPPFKD